MIHRYTDYRGWTLWRAPTAPRQEQWRAARGHEGFAADSKLALLNRIDRRMKEAA
jgi:hypothetical protein